MAAVGSNFVDVAAVAIAVVAAGVAAVGPDAICGTAVAGMAALVPMPSVARPLLLGSMSSIMLVNLCVLMDGSGFADVMWVEGRLVVFF
jgi:hypothetical protein